MAVEDNAVPRKAKLGYRSVSSLLNQGYVKIGTIGDTSVYFDERISDNSSTTPKTIYVLGISSSVKSKGGLSKVVFELFLTKSKEKMGDKLCYYVEMMSVDDMFKGHNAGPMVYAFILHNIKKLILKCGISQSPGAKVLWNNLAKEKGVSMYAYNPTTGEHYLCKPGIDSVKCEVNVYERSSKFALYAAAKSSLYK